MSPGSSQIKRLPEQWLIVPAPPAQLTQLDGRGSVRCDAPLPPPVECSTPAISAQCQGQSFLGRKPLLLLPLNGPPGCKGPADIAHSATTSNEEDIHRHSAPPASSQVQPAQQLQRRAELQGRAPPSPGNRRQRCQEVPHSAKCARPKKTSMCWALELPTDRLIPSGQLEQAQNSRHPATAAPSLLL